MILDLLIQVNNTIFGTESNQMGHILSRRVFEQDKGRKCNELLAEIDKLSFRLQRQSDIVVFPLLNLPKVVIFEVVEKLHPKHRRHLMQSCSKFRQLLHAQKAKRLDCRLPAEIFCKFHQDESNLNFTVRVSKEYRKNYWTYKATVNENSSEWPIELIESFQGISENFDSEKINFFLTNVTNTAFHPAVVRILGEASKYFPPIVICSKDLFEPDQWAMLVLDCPRTISLSLEHLHKSILQQNPHIQPYRTAMDDALNAAAVAKGIPVVIDSSEPEEKTIVLRLNVAVNGEKTLVIYEWLPNQ